MEQLFLDAKLLKEHLFKIAGGKLILNYQFSKKYSVQSRSLTRLLILLIILTLRGKREILKSYSSRFRKISKIKVPTLVVWDKDNYVPIAKVKNC